MGEGVAGAGDVNGDGFADVIVGAAGTTRARSTRAPRSCSTAARRGSANGNPATAATPARARPDRGRAVRHERGGRRRREPRRLRRRDRRRRLATTRVRPTRARRSYSRAARRASRTATPRPPHAQLESDQAGGVLGASVAEAGDVERRRLCRRDRGGAGSTTRRSDEGRRSCSRGAGRDRGRQPHDGRGAARVGPGTRRSGPRVAGAGDVNGDGHPDVIVGATGLRRAARPTRARRSCS